MVLIVAALRLVVLLMKCGNDRVFFLLRDFCLAPDEGYQMAMGRWNSSMTVRFCCSPSFSGSSGRPAGPTTFAFAIAYSDVATSSFLG